MNTDTPTPSIIDHPSSYLARIAELERELAEAKETLASEGRQFTAYQSAAREAHNHHLSVVKERDDLREELAALKRQNAVLLVQQRHEEGVRADMKEEIVALNGIVETLQSAQKNAFERMTNAETELAHAVDMGDQCRAALEKQLTAWREDARKLAMRLQSFGLRLTEVDKEALIAHERLLNLAPDAPVHSPPTPAA